MTLILSNNWFILVFVNKIVYTIDNTDNGIQKYKKQLYLYWN